MNTSTAPQRPTMVAGEVRGAAVSFAGKLAQVETLTGTPTATPSPGGLACSSAKVSATALTINGRSVPAGKAVVFTVGGGTAAVEYTVTVTCGTTNGQVLIGRCVILVEA